MFMISISTAVSYLIVSAYAEALLVNDTSINLDEGHQLRSLRLPVVHERPPNCLPPAVQFGNKDYCWFNLENKARTDRHAGLLVLSNGAYRNFFSTLELEVLWANSKPYDVGVWADGYTFRHIDLEYGLTLDLLFFVPTVSLSGGEDVHGTKQLKFDTVLLTTVSVPHVGTVRAEDKQSAFAAVQVKELPHPPTPDDHPAFLRAKLQAQNKALSVGSDITFQVNIYPVNAKFEWWIYECIVNVDITYVKDGKDFYYKQEIIIFRETSKR
ncbi:hypothetical protein Pmar_PMAR022775 [Perkinsus marinus ATCC 50983]|uniref:Uncharacterized protein n=1 Tax=Perkinsus marinus (strain ATCC 50983 / TXsc) TaxID=423536 RepID=C5KWU9_PERM5|nr:hypothetical protein Pmar_PMAR022775 [Perkinsus marinus ATCC 50983]EER11055.1 hypothetical protein Pmar_PMAR022775 [Perkinsus marinus ATCC 50983]|eukprot:XP_002779260.1 hypothetical protein Pmar_PMAR022775 [Perkinsus marinus ATCC 50983]